jgi:hypothetical protein
MIAGRRIRLFTILHPTSIFEEKSFQRIHFLIPVLSIASKQCAHDYGFSFIWFLRNNQAVRKRQSYWAERKFIFTANKEKIKSREP